VKSESSCGWNCGIKAHHLHAKGPIEKRAKIGFSPPLSKGEIHFLIFSVWCPWSSNPKNTKKIPGNHGGRFY